MPSWVIAIATAAVRFDARRTETSMATSSKRAGEKYWHEKLAGISPGATSAAAARSAIAAM